MTVSTIYPSLYVLAMRVLRRLGQFALGLVLGLLVRLGFLLVMLLERLLPVVSLRQPVLMPIGKEALVALFRFLVSRVHALLLHVLGRRFRVFLVLVVVLLLLAVHVLVVVERRVLLVLVLVVDVVVACRLVALLVALVVRKMLALRRLLRLLFLLVLLRLVLVGLLGARLVHVVAGFLRLRLFALGALVELFLYLE